MTTLLLSSKDRSKLRADAHHLKPIVLIGDNGLSDSVLKEIDHSLTAHGLIKVRYAGDDRQTRLDIVQAICEQLEAAKVSLVGKTLTLFRPTNKHPDLLKPEKAPVERSKRLPNEEYTPKKLAAAGKTIADKKRRPASPKGNSDIVKTARKTVAGDKTRSGPNIPRRAGSALSLRAGRRSR